MHRTARADLVEAPNLQFFLQKTKNARFFTSNEIKADASPPLSAGAAKRRVENSYREDNTIQISTQSCKRLLFAALFLALLIPLFFAFALRAQLPLLGFEMEKKSTVGQIIRQVKGHGHYIWDLNLFSETQEKSGGPVCGTFTLWVNGKTTLDEEIQALEALDGVSYMTLMSKRKSKNRRGRPRRFSLLCRLYTPC